MSFFKIFRRLAAASAAACVLFLCTGCNIPMLEKDGDGSGYLFTTSLIGNPKSLDPQSATDASSKTIIRNLYEGLLEMDDTGTPQLAAASSYTVSPDGLIYTFLLRKDRYWFYDKNGNDTVDDGETWLVTASDYAYAFQRIFDPQTQSPYAETFSCLHNAEAVQNGTLVPSEIGVRAVSDDQLQFTLDQPNAQFLAMLTTTAAMPCNEEFFLQTKGSYGLEQNAVASCGAFYMRLWFYDPYGSDNLIYMRQNAANAEARRTYPTNLTFHIRNGQQALDEDFSSGESDVLLTSVYPAAYVDSKDYTVTSERDTTLGLIFNPDEKEYANDAIRTALSMGIDRSKIGLTSNGDLLSASAIVPPTVYCNGTSYRDAVPETDLTPAYDESAAIAMLQKGMQQLGIASLNSTKILTCASLMDCDHLHDIIQNWQEIFGFYIGIDEVTESEYWDKIENKNYTIAVYGVTGTEASPDAVLAQFATDCNRFRYSSAKVDQLLSSLRSCADTATFFQLCRTAEQTILDEAQFLPIFYKNQYLVTQTSNADLHYDAFSGAIDFRNAKHFE